MKFLFFISVFTFILFLSVFIDRFILSRSGFNSVISLIALSFLLMANITLSLLLGAIAFPSFFTNSMLFVLLAYHSMSFLVINLIFIYITYTMFVMDYLIKILIKNPKFVIFTCNHISYKNLLTDKKFLTISIAISYFISTVVILFPIPPMLLSMFKYDKTLVDLISSEIQTYQQFFVFASIPILFSLIKKN